MFDRYGKMTSLEQLNEKAALLKQAGDLEGLKTLAKENGLLTATAYWYMEDKVGEFATLPEAAIGRIDAELNEIDIRESVMMCGMIVMFRYVIKK